MKGIYDHSNEILVEAPKEGHQGAFVITPLYTHIKDNKNIGILVNWGWLSSELREPSIWNNSNINPKGL